MQSDVFNLPLFVPPHIRSAHEGVAWTLGYDNMLDYDPDRET